MGSFLIGTGVTLVTFYIALIYGSIAIGLIGFAELVLMLLACLYLLIYCRHITADIRIPLTVAEKGKKVTVQLTVDQTMLFPAAKVRYRVRCRNTFAGYARNFWWNGAGLMRGMQCMEKRVVLSHVGSYEYELVKVRIYDLTGLFYVHKKIKRFADIQVLPELDAVAVQVSERVRRYFGEAESYDDFQPGTDVSQIFDVRGSPAAHTLETLRQIGRASGAGGQSAACLCGGIFAGHAATDGRKRPAYEAQQGSLCGNLSHNCGRSGVFDDGCRLPALCGMAGGNRNQTVARRG